MRIFLSLLLAAAVGTAPLSADAPWRRSVTAIGTVWINHVALPTGAGVSPGDRLHTAGDSLAMLHDPILGRFEVRPSSVVNFQDARVELVRGAVGSAGRSVAVGNTLVESAGAGEAWFVVAEKDGRAFVAAYRGALALTELDSESRAPLDGEPILVSAGSYAIGSYAMAAALPPVPQRQRSDSDGTVRRRRPTRGTRSRRSRGAGGAASKGGWSIGGLGTTASLVLLTGVGAAAVTGTALGLSTLLDEPASPSR